MGRRLPFCHPIAGGVRACVTNRHGGIIGCGNAVELGQWAADKDTVPGEVRDWQAPESDRVTDGVKRGSQVLPLWGDLRPQLPCSLWGQNF